MIDRCRPWIEAALEYCGGTYAFEDVQERIADGRMQLWPADDACAVTEISVYPRRTILTCVFAGGNMDTLKKMAPAMEAWGRSQGCDGTEIYGRRGWVRALHGLGYRESSVAVRKEL
ncbi:hypothetical protein PE067_16210 [Paracoccus sp. DMF-8]|uniref:hypothetical protein n=1 Tax=Paracoccus sp. DMF-8 TaxID=3019445 RepID=UPI0023E3DD86|nr:hypothetical protein [Paracoccus sp. DMF-8]MDF3607552.1 hypothetical protein [Paracoccus sp. DMF-8]